MAKQEITYKTEVINGKEVKIQVIPSGMRNIPKEGEIVDNKANKKKTTKPNPTKDGILAELLQLIEEKDIKIYKSKTGYSFKVDDQWLTMGLTGNRSEPKDLTEWVKEE